MPEVLPKPIEVFYPGTHTDFRRKVVKVERSDLEKTVSWFNSSGGRIPIVVAHPGSEDENFGFATKLGLNGDRMVVTEVDELDRSFKAIVNSGELPKVSVKLRLPGHPSNVSDGYELQHIGFFGKSRVALDRLKEASFSHPDNNLEFYFNYMDKKKMVDPEETMDEEMEDEETVEVPSKKKKSAKTAEMAAHEAEVAAFQAEKAAFKRARKIEPVVEEWVREGKITPASKAGLVAVFAALPEDLEVSFSDADGEESTQTASEFLTEFMAALPKTIMYGEFSGVKKAEGKAKTVAFSANYDSDNDGTIDADSVAMLDELAAQGVDFTNAVAFAEAVDKYSRGKK